MMRTYTDNLVANSVGLFKGLPAPICSTLGLEQLRLLVESKGWPEDEPKNHTFLTTLSPSCALPKSFFLLVDDAVSALRGGMKGGYLDALRWHAEQYVLNLSRALLMNMWLVVPQHKSHYIQGSYLSCLGFKYENVRRLSTYFADVGLVNLKEGKKYQKQPLAHRVYPTHMFNPEWAEFGFHLKQPFVGPYLRCTDTKSDFHKLLMTLPEDHPDWAGLQLINEFMQTHTWALKAPIILQYRNSAFEGGRVYTPFQNLPSRRFNIRNQTYIDGQPICEVDYSANHLRMLLGLFFHTDAGDDPYLDIAGDTRPSPNGTLTERKNVKGFFTVAMGASGRIEGYKALNGMGYTTERIDAIEAAALRRFPMIEKQLFNGFGVKAQSFEGQILMSAMQQAIADDKLLLPVHDAGAVKLTDKDYAVALLQEVWNSSNVALGGARTRVSVK